MPNTLNKRIISSPLLTEEINFYKNISDDMLSKNDKLEDIISLKEINSEISAEKIIKAFEKQIKQL